MQVSGEPTTFVTPKFNQQPQRLRHILFAFCMVVVAETPTRLLIKPRTPKQGAFFYYPKLISYGEPKEDDGRGRESMETS